MQMYGDSASLQRALVTLDEYTIVSMRGSEDHAEEDLALVSRTLRKQPVSPGKAIRGHERNKSLDSEGGDSKSLHTVAIVSQVITGMQVRIFAVHDLEISPEILICWMCLCIGAGQAGAVHLPVAGADGAEHYEGRGAQQLVPRGPSE